MKFFSVTAYDYAFKIERAPGEISWFPLVQKSLFRSWLRGMPACSGIFSYRGAPQFSTIYHSGTRRQIHLFLQLGLFLSKNVSINMFMWESTYFTFRYIFSTLKGLTAPPSIAPAVPLHHTSSMWTPLAQTTPPFTLTLPSSYCRKCATKASRTWTGNI